MNTITAIATVSILMAAKLEEDSSPIYQNVIKLLTYEEQRHVSYHMLIDLEYEIVYKFGCDFNFPGPIESLQRFLFLLQ